MALERTPQTNRHFRVAALGRGRRRSRTRQGIPTKKPRRAFWAGALIVPSGRWIRRRERPDRDGGVGRRSDRECDPARNVGECGDGREGDRVGGLVADDLSLDVVSDLVRAPGFPNLTSKLPSNLDFPRISCSYFVQFQTHQPVSFQPRRIDTELTPQADPKPPFPETNRHRVPRNFSAIVYYFHPRSGVYFPARSVAEMQHFWPSAVDPG